jgi:uncharacterized metal-binding protein
MSETTALAKKTDYSSLEAVLAQGDLSKLSAEQRTLYYKTVCETMGLNPLTKPFEFLNLNNKVVMYANKGCAEQLRSIHKISITVTAREMIGDLCVVTANAKGTDGREDSSTGAVSISGLKGEALANAMMKAETKAKRRVTLSICGLNMLDDSEIGSIPGAKRFDPEADKQKLETVNAIIHSKPEPKPEPKAVEVAIRDFDDESNDNQMEAMAAAREAESRYIQEHFGPPDEIQMDPNAKPDPNRFVVTFGRDKDRELGTFNDFELTSLRTWIQTKAKPPLGKVMLDHLDAINAVISQRQRAAEKLA